MLEYGFFFPINKIIYKKKCLIKFNKKIHNTLIVLYGENKNETVIIVIITIIIYNWRALGVLRGNH